MKFKIKILLKQMSVYYAEKNCEGVLKNGAPCKNKAYFLVNKNVFCGVHSRNKDKEKLPKNPFAAEERLEKKKRLLKKAKKWQGGKRIRLTKLQMRKTVDRHEGAYGIYPNFKHGNKMIDEIGFPTLSPKYAWVPKHKMKTIVDGELVRVPQAKNIENFHQGSKVFEEEGFYKRREEMFLDDVPWRHQFDKYPELKQVGKNKNVPLYSIFSDSLGNEKRFTYLECRYFYCFQYEKMCRTNPDFQKLKEMYDNGSWLQIIGYDAYQPERVDRSDCQPAQEYLNEESDNKNLFWDAYNDTTKPFGHELVLATLLVLENPKHYPWNRFWKKNKEKYFDDWEKPDCFKE